MAFPTGCISHVLFTFGIGIRVCVWCCYALCVQWIFMRSPQYKTAFHSCRTLARLGFFFWFVCFDAPFYFSALISYFYSFILLLSICPCASLSLLLHPFFVCVYLPPFLPFERGADIFCTYNFAPAMSFWYHWLYFLFSASFLRCACANMQCQLCGYSEMCYRIWRVLFVIFISDMHWK